jgi:hypothetical protein
MIKLIVNDLGWQDNDRTMRLYLVFNLLSKFLVLDPMLAHSFCGILLFISFDYTCCIDSF